MNLENTWARREENGQDWLFLTGDWRVSQLDKVLGNFVWERDGKGCEGVSLRELLKADSATLALLMEWTQAARQHGAALRIRDVSSSLQELIHLYRLQELLMLHHD